MTAYDTCAVAIARGCIGASQVVALLSEVIVNGSVATYRLTMNVAGIASCSVELAVVAVLIGVLNSISALLGGCAVVVARVGDKYAVDHVTIDDIAVVTGLAIVYGAIAAATDVDADGLVGGALLSRPAESVAT